jgi:hypothetical protein
MLDHFVIEHAYKAGRDWLEDAAPTEVKEKASFGTRFSLSMSDNSRQPPTVYWHSKQRNTSNMSMSSIATGLVCRIARAFLAMQAVPATPELFRVPCFTECFVNDNWYRGHPCYRSTSPWHDWAYILWAVDGGVEDETEERYLCRIEFFVDFTWAQGRVVLPRDDVDVSPGRYVVVRCARTVAPISNSKLLLRARFDFRERYYLAPVESICDPAFVVEGIGGVANEVFVGCPHHKWGRLFGAF